MAPVAPEQPPTYGPTLDDVRTARSNIESVALRTPTVVSSLTDDVAAPILLKLETLQPTGSFKLRGAANAIAQLSPAERERGVACCSTGNHGRAVAYAANTFGTRAVVCLSSLVPDVKVRAIEALGAEVRRVGSSQDDAQEEVDRLVASQGLVEIPPFDHRDVISGQGTIGLELVEGHPDLEAILVPLSGGGLAGGIALAAKALNPDISVIGVTLEAGAAMAESLRAGRAVQIHEEASLADSLGGGIGLDNRYTFDLCNNLLDEVIQVSDSQIYDAMRFLFFSERLIAEGASAVGHAAILSGLFEVTGPTALVISGGNVDMDQFACIVAGDPVQIGDHMVTGEDARGGV